MSVSLPQHCTYPLALVLFHGRYIALRVGIAVRPGTGQLWWSTLMPAKGAAPSNYTQVLGGKRFTLRLSPSSAPAVVAQINGRTVFTSTGGQARFITDLEGGLVAIVGIDSQPHDHVCAAPVQATTTTHVSHSGGGNDGRGDGGSMCVSLKPNQVWAVGQWGRHPTANLTGAAPFTAPF